MVKFHYPTEVHYSCHNSGHCCSSYVIPVSTTDNKKLAKLPIAKKLPELKDISYTQPSTTQTGGHILATGSALRCVFLDEQNLCKLHKVFDATSKPLACQIFPYTFTVAPDGVYVGLKFSCPSVAASKGSPLSEKRAEIEYLYKAYCRNFQPPTILGEVEINQRSLEWDEVKTIEELLIGTLQLPELPLWRRMLLVLELFDLLSHSLQGESKQKRIEFWRILAEGTWKKAVRLSAPQPHKLKSSQRRLFLQMIYYFSQAVDNTGITGESAVKKLWSGIKFMYNKGTIFLPFSGEEIKVKEVLSQIKHIEGELAQKLLTGYFITKIQSQSFFNASFFGYSFADGLNFLAMLYPIISWYAYAYALAAHKTIPDTQEVIQAIRCVDDTYAAGAVFGGPGTGLRNFAVREFRIPQNIICSIEQNHK